MHLLVGLQVSFACLRAILQGSFGMHTCLRRHFVCIPRQRRRVHAVKQELCPQLTVPCFEGYLLVRRHQRFRLRAGVVHLADFKLFEKFRRRPLQSSEAKSFEQWSEIIQFIHCLSEIIHDLSEIRALERAK